MAEAIITLVTSNDFVVGAQVLAYSLRHVGTSKQLVVMVTDGVSSESRDKLRQSGWYILEVPVIPNPNTGVHVQSWIDVGFTKLRLWQLTQFRRLVYIDADCLVVQPVDQLFMLDTDFAAAPDVFPPDRLNAGVMVVRPNHDVWRRMLQSFHTIASYDGGDTGFLNMFFPNWYTGDASSRLSFGYNALRIMQWFTKKKPSYWHAIQPLKIIHYCSSPKPWEDRDRGGDVERQWWATHSAMMADTKSIVPGADIKMVVTYDSDNKDNLAMKRPLTWNDLSHITWNNSMGKRPIRFGIWSHHDESWLGLLRGMYDRHIAITTSSSSSSSSSDDVAVIPRLVHQIWLGGDCPSRYDAWRTSWQHHHASSAGWTYRLHGDHELTTRFPYSRGGPHETHLRALMANATSHVERSDIFRLDILLHFGGVYIDTDFECINSMRLLHSQPSVHFYAGVSNTGTVELNNGLIGSRAGHSLLVKLIMDMKLGMSASPTPMDIITRSGPGHFTRCFMSAAATDATLLPLPISYTYPFPNNMRGLPLADRSVYNTAETLAVHHWDCSWQGSSSAAAIAPVLTASSLIDMITRRPVATADTSASSSSSSPSSSSLSSSGASSVVGTSSPATCIQPVASARVQAAPRAVDQAAMARSALLGKIAGFL